MLLSSGCYHHLNQYSFSIEYYNSLLPHPYSINVVVPLLQHVQICSAGFFSLFFFFLNYLLLFIWCKMQHFYLTLVFSFISCVTLHSLWEIFINLFWLKERKRHIVGAVIVHSLTSYVGITKYEQTLIFISIHIYFIIQIECDTPWQNSNSDISLKQIFFIYKNNSCL